MTQLGPRSINYIDQGGTRGVIKIVLSYTGWHSSDLGDGETSTYLAGTIEVECPLFKRIMKIQGDDELHVAMLLMWFSDTWLRRVCSENGIIIYKWREGDIADEFSVYKP